MAHDRSLLVFAHRDEAAAFADVAHLVTGVGKINASVSLARAIAELNPDRVVVLGTAGALGDGASRPRLDEVYQVSAAVQHDFSLPSPRLELTGLLLLPEALRATIATGDVFVKDDAQRAHIAELGATLVDMETYAYAQVCAEWSVPLQVFKVPSDFADSSTTDADWDQIVFQKSAQLREFWEALGSAPAGS